MWMIMGGSKELIWFWWPTGWATASLILSSKLNRHGWVWSLLNCYFYLYRTFSSLYQVAYTWCIQNKGTLSWCGTWQGQFQAIPLSLLWWFFPPIPSLLNRWALVILALHWHLQQWCHYASSFIDISKFIRRDTASANHHSTHGTLIFLPRKTSLMFLLFQLIKLCSFNAQLTFDHCPYCPSNLSPVHSYSFKMSKCVTCHCAVVLNADVIEFSDSAHFFFPVPPMRTKGT